MKKINFCGYKTVEGMTISLIGTWKCATHFMDRTTGKRRLQKMSYLFLEVDHKLPLQACY